MILTTPGLPSRSFSLDPLTQLIGLGPCLTGHVSERSYSSIKPRDAAARIAMLTEQTKRSSHLTAHSVPLHPPQRRSPVPACAALPPATPAPAPAVLQYSPAPSARSRLFAPRHGTGTNPFETAARNNRMSPTCRSLRQSPAPCRQRSA